LTENLTKIYGRGKNKVVAVDGIDLLIKGGVHGFLGPNGAGKTSTMNMIIGAIPITEGTAKVRGYPAGSLKAKKRIGFLPQQVSFYEKMSGKQFLVHSARLFGMEYEKALRASESLLQRFDLSEVADRKVGKYSGGMKQKLGLAAAFIGPPDILILDEPTSDLDPIGRDKIISYVKDLSKETSIFVSSHILSEVEEMCDTVTVINHGKILLTDTIENLKKIYGDASKAYIIDTTDNKRVKNMLQGESFLRKVWLDEETGVIRAIPKDSTQLERYIGNLMVKDGITIKKYAHDEISLKQIFIDIINEVKEKL
jgi:ABC-2 type transport system ATP-binding protein